MRRIGNVVAYYSWRDYPSHHFHCRFEYRDIWFTSVEQFMMYSKAKLFGDEEVAKKILETDNCQAQKMLGRDVQGFVEAVWKAKRNSIVFVANREKYRQNPNLLSLLLLTGDAILVEASERDRLWGAGLHENDDRIADPTKWRGLNLHGQIQMGVRDYFRKEGRTT